MSNLSRVCLFILAFIPALVSSWGSVEAQNALYLSTNLERSEASYIIHFLPTYSGRVDKFRLRFPAGILNGNIRMGDFSMAGRALTNVTATIDPGDSNVLWIDRSTSFSVRPGTSLLMELMGLQNPLAGNYQVEVTLHNHHGVVLETMTPLGLSIASLVSDDRVPGDITTVNAGIGLTGGTASGAATLAISSSYQLPQTCSHGQVAKSNGASGWSCGSDSDSGGDITAVIAGTGLTGGATTGDATLNVNTVVIQSRVTGKCASGSTIRQINADGTVDCETDHDSGGTVTGVTASWPLTSSGGATPNITLPTVTTDKAPPYRTAIGANALAANTIGSENTAAGVTALGSNTAGNGNTAVGWAALLANTTGSNNTAVGGNATVSAGDLTNATAIGYGAVADASNKMRLGNSSITVIEGQVAFTANSDRNKKENFRPVDGEEVLRKIRELSIPSWNLIGHDPEKFRHYGPMAQDFFAAFGKDGVGQIGTETTINSGDVAGILMIAVQALEKRTKELNQQEARISALEEETRSNKAQLEKLKRDLKHGEHDHFNGRRVSKHSDQNSNESDKKPKVPVAD